jgi:glyoxylase-like metal-dependent hydrolase (beta-lactamase superfamily II)
MIFRQLFDYETYTYSYLLACDKTKEAVLIDSVNTQSERDSNLIKELGLDLKFLFETHVHADHITGVSLLKDKFPNAKSVVSKDGGTKCTDIYIDDNDEIKFGELCIKVISTPGHTNGCVSYYIENMVFTGDTLFIRGSGRTDFQQGSSENLYNSVTQKLFNLPDETIVYPGHDYKGLSSSTIWEEKKFNPRFSKTKEEFFEIMNNLNLPHPKKINEAVPANLKCGNLTT